MVAGIFGKFAHKRRGIFGTIGQMSTWIFAIHDFGWMFLSGTGWLGGKAVSEICIEERVGRLDGDFFHLEKLFEFDLGGFGA